MTQPALPHAQYHRFESMREYESMFDELVTNTQNVIRIFDRTLSAAYNSPLRCEALAAFLRADPLNRLHVVLHETEGLEQVCPRFIALLQRFNHVAKARQTPRWARHVHDPFVIFDASHYLHRFHYAHMRFARGRDEIEGAQQLLDRFGELWDASQPALGATVLGL